MGPVFFVFSIILLFLRGDIGLLRAARRGRDAVTERVSNGQRTMARKVFLLARMLGGLRTEFPRFPAGLPRVFMIVSNHQSIADIPAITLCLPHHGVRFVAKRELRRGIPYVSRSLRFGRSALISRTANFGQGQRELRNLGRLSEEAICPVIFPEGTRSRTGKVGEFFSGAVRIILERHPMPVLAVAVDGGHSIATIPRVLLHLRGAMYRVKPLTLHPTPHGKKEILELLGQLRTEITAQVERWRLSDAKKPIPGA